MKPSSPSPLRVLLAAVLLLISCDVSTIGTVQQVPTAVPGALNLIIAQTAAAAATQTAALTPPTPTPSSTPQPSPAPSGTATATPTFVFVVFTATPLGGTKGYSCNFVSRNPANGTNIGRRANFTGKWKITNDGGINWDANTVDFVFASGYNFASVSEMKLPYTVGTGSSITLSLDMTAPKTAGTFTTNWNLRAGVKIFCSLSLTMVVN